MNRSELSGGLGCAEEAFNHLQHAAERITSNSEAAQLHQARAIVAAGLAIAAELHTSNLLMGLLEGLLKGADHDKAVKEILSNLVTPEGN